MIGFKTKIKPIEEKVYVLLNTAAKKVQEPFKEKHN